MAWLLAPLILLSILFRRQVRVLVLVALQTGWARDLAGDWSADARVALARPDRRRANAARLSTKSNPSHSA